VSVSSAPATSPESEEIAAVALAAERALRELDAAISSSLELSEMSDDPASAQVLFCLTPICIPSLTAAPSQLLVVLVYCLKTGAL
jgi:hypothetical protein